MQAQPPHKLFKCVSATPPGAGFGDEGRLTDAQVWTSGNKLYMGMLATFTTRELSAANAAV